MNMFDSRRYDPNQRPSNSKLRTTSIIQSGFIFMLCGGASLLLYAMISLTHANGLGYLLSILIGGGIGLAIFRKKNLKHAIKKRDQFISVGGDPSGITLFMFGAMGGRVLPDGTWDWVIPSSDGGDGVYIGDGGGDSGGGDGGGGD